VYPLDDGDGRIPRSQDPESERRKARGLSRRATEFPQEPARLRYVAPEPSIFMIWYTPQGNAGPESAWDFTDVDATFDEPAPYERSEVGPG
jgi:hypothetical protein